MTFKAYSKNQWVRRVFWALGEHVFACTILLIGIAFIISAALFYVYVIQAQVSSVQIPEAVLRFRKDVFGQVLSQWKTQGNALNEADHLAPRNIFRYNPKAPL